MYDKKVNIQYYENYYIKGYKDFSIRISPYESGYVDSVDLDLNYIYKFKIAMNLN